MAQTDSDSGSWQTTITSWERESVPDAAARAQHAGSQGVTNATGNMTTYQNINYKEGTNQVDTHPVDGNKPSNIPEVEAPLNVPS